MSAAPGPANLPAPPTLQTRPAGARAIPAEFNSWLVSLQALADHHDSDIYVHPRLIGFRNCKEKTNWLGENEYAAEMDLFSSLKSGNKKGLRLAVCSTTKGTWVGKPKGSVKWHVWGVAVKCGARGEGKKIYIYDCSQDKGTVLDKHAKDLVTQKARLLLHDMKS